MSLTRTAAAILAALSIAAPAAAQTVVIVRHAEKADSSPDPVLSEAGTARAAALAQALKGARITTLVVSPRQRTRLTGAPAAGAASLVTIGFENGDAAHVAAIAAAARAAPADATVLVVGHSNTVAEIARALGDADPEPLTDCDYDKMVILQLGKGPVKALHARYGAPTQAC